MKKYKEKYTLALILILFAWYCQMYIAMEDAFIEGIERGCRDRVFVTSSNNLELQEGYKWCSIIIKNIQTYRWDDTYYGKSNSN